MSDVMTFSKRTAAGLEEVLRTLLLDSENKVPAERLRIVGAIADGAIIEQGSNSNGDWCRLSDGTQWCWGKTSALSLTFNSYGDLFQATHLITFPARFINANVSCAVSAVVGAGAPWANVLTPSATNVILRVFDILDRTDVLTTIFYWSAIGRWKA